MRKDGVLLAVLLCLSALGASAQNPSPTRGTLTGTLRGPSVNGAIDPAQFAGSDIGAQIKDNGETVDPSKITITCAKKGYKMVKQPTVPQKAEGTFEIDFVMAKEMASN